MPRVGRASDAAQFDHRSLTPSRRLTSLPRGQVLRADNRGNAALTGLANFYRSPAAVTDAKIWPRPTLVIDDVRALSVRGVFIGFEILGLKTKKMCSISVVNYWLLGPSLIQPQNCILRNCEIRPFIWLSKQETFLWLETVNMSTGYRVHAWFQLGKSAYSAGLSCPALHWMLSNVSSLILALVLWYTSIIYSRFCHLICTLLPSLPNHSQLWNRELTVLWCAMAEAAT